MTIPKLLIVDDEKSLCRALSAFFEDYDYEVRIGLNGREGLDVLSEWKADAVLVDLNMPVMNGFEFIKAAHALYPDLPIVVISGVGVVEQAVEALRLGAWEYLTKPVVELTLVRDRVEKALERARLLRENREYQRGLEDKVRARTSELEQIKRQLIYSLGKSAEYRDNETGAHVVRVGEVCRLLALGLGFSPAAADVIRDAAPLHDIGKIGVPDHILLKPGRLNDDEMTIMRRHCEMGYAILQTHADVKGGVVVSCESFLEDYSGDQEPDMLEMAKVIALCHHERWDGAGYPCGLAGEAIPLEARIVSVADVYDALGSDRSYKKAFDEETCRRIVGEGAGTQFDPGVVDVLFQNFDAVMNIKSLWKD